MAQRFRSPAPAPLDHGLVHDFGPLAFRPSDARLSRSALAAGSREDRASSNAGALSQTTPWSAAGVDGELA